MSDDDHIDNDAEVFRTAMSGVERQQPDREIQRRPRPRPVPRPRTEAEPLELHDGPLAEAPRFLEFRRPGIQNRVYRDLTRGVIPAEADIDLHGMRVVEARAALARFLEHNLARGRRCIRIVHGKGYRSDGRQPVLKQCVNQWLQQRDEVLAFCTAPRWDGGTGAAYVLLSRKLRRRG